MDAWRAFWGSFPLTPTLEEANVQECDSEEYTAYRHQWSRVEDLSAESTNRPIKVGGFSVYNRGKYTYYLLDSGDETAISVLENCDLNEVYLHGAQMDRVVSPCNIFLEETSRTTTRRWNSIEGINNGIASPLQEPEQVEEYNILDQTITQEEEMEEEDMAADTSTHPEIHRIATTHEQQNTTLTEEIQGLKEAYEKSRERLKADIAQYRSECRQLQTRSAQLEESYYRLHSTLYIAEQQVFQLEAQLQDQEKDIGRLRRANDDLECQVHTVTRELRQQQQLQESARNL